VLEDPKGVLGYQRVAMVMNKDRFEQLEGQEFFGGIDEVSALLTNEAMISMNKAVAIDKQDEAEVARSFLEANQLL
jgi:glycine betaine/choline ABC-type transport system substrate-binding protein